MSVEERISENEKVGWNNGGGKKQKHMTEEIFSCKVPSNIDLRFWFKQKLTLVALGALSWMHIRFIICIWLKRNKKNNKWILIVLNLDLKRGLSRGIYKKVLFVFFFLFKLWIILVCNCMNSNSVVFKKFFLLLN